MTSGADLFVVCKQCGSEVSPYITECPYCGTRLRRRAPKLPRVNAAPPAPAARSGLISRFGAAAARTRPAKAALAARLRHRRPLGGHPALRDDRAGRCVLRRRWVAGARQSADLVPEDGRRRAAARRLVEAVHHPVRLRERACYAFVAIVTVALFGWLLERRHGPVVVLALFFGAGAAGALAGARGSTRSRS